MKKAIKHIGLDVHKNSISIAIADFERDGEIRYHGTINNDMKQLDKIIRKMIFQGYEVDCIYEAGPYGYHNISSFDLLQHQMLCYCSFPYSPQEW
jgi:hypothetical protein